MFKQAQSCSLVLSLPLTHCLSLKKLGKMGLLLTCLQAVGDSWILSKHKAVKCSVLGPHPDQTSTDLQKVGFPGVHVSVTPRGLSDGRPPETYADCYYCDCESSLPSVPWWFYVFFVLHSIDDFLNCCDSLLQDILWEVLRWLETHPQEVVILACRNFDGLTKKLHCNLIACIKEIFQCKLCPRNVSMRSCFSSFFQE